jgi:Mg2+ and Co2+ transporter CorA
MTYDDYESFLSETHRVLGEISDVIDATVRDQNDFEYSPDDVVVLEDIQAHLLEALAVFSDHFEDMADVADDDDRSYGPRR